jgi:shikimate dehydrogenase
MTLTGGGRVAGIMGWPVGHSRSPALHGFWLAEAGIDGVYVPLPVRPEHLAQALRALAPLGFRGCNLTIPHKEAALLVADRVDPLGRRIGSVNTIIVQPDGTLDASSTDGFGFRENLRDCAPDWQPDRGPAVVLGAGGSARAVVASLTDAGAAEIRIVNRTLARAEKLARELATATARISVHGWADSGAVLDGAGLLVNTTSLGMTGQPSLNIDLAALPTGAPVADLVYTPLVETPLLAAARQRGHRIVDGLGTLLHQGRPGFEAWFGAPARVTPELRAAVLATLAPAR